MLIRFKNHGPIELSQLTTEIYPVGRFTVHPKVAIDPENKRVDVSSTEWQISHIETGTSIGTFSDRIDAVNAAQSLGCLAFPDDIMLLKGNKPFERAILAIIEYHGGASTSSRKHHDYPKS